MSRFTLALLLLHSSFAPSALAARCHGSAEVLSPSGKYCYILQITAKNYNDAEKACFQYGGYELAKIDNMVDNNFLWNYVKNNGDVFIGATDVTSDGNWRWPDGSPLTFMNWAPAPKVGSCASMRWNDGRWLRDDCEEKLPSLCYGPSIGGPTNAPTTTPTTTKPLFHEEQNIFFVGDTEFMGSPLGKKQVADYYTKQKEFIKTIGDNAFLNYANGNSVCDVYADFSFYGWSSIQQETYDGYLNKREGFDSGLARNDFTDPDVYQMTNITTALEGLRKFRWTPYLPKTVGYTVLVFFTGRKDFTGIPSIEYNYLNINEVVVVQMNGAKMPIPVNNRKYSAVSISSNFNQDDVNIVENALKCH